MPVHGQNTHLRGYRAYYATLAHEMGHWTGHPSRLNRETITRWHSEEARAVEEILAEFTAAFTCASLGIDHDLREDSTAYIGSWLRVLGKRQPIPAGGAAGVKFHGRSSSRRSMVWPRARRSSTAAM
jgi:antirestriction protein ArdC